LARRAQARQAKAIDPKEEAVAKKNGHEGIDVRHARACPSRTEGRCSCTPTYQGHVWSAREKKRIRKTFPTLAAAKAWRQDAQVGLRKGTMRAPSSVTIRQAAEAWLAGARDGSVRNRSGAVYKPSAIRGYDAALRDRILPDFGGLRLSDLQRRDVQDLADRLVSKGLDPSTIRNALMPLRVIYRRAVSRGDVAVNPCTGLELPAVEGRRDRIASPEEGAALLATLPMPDRAVWATAMYAGLRSGEMQGLRWEDIDFAKGLIRVERSFDPSGVFVEPKSKAGRRRVPIPAVLRSTLAELKLRSGRAEGLVFGRTPQVPFDHSSFVRRARKAWKAENKRREEDLGRELEPGEAVNPIGFHECRHTFASLMIAAGVNAKALSTYMGHSSITITIDRYGHLMPGNEDEAAGLLDALLEKSGVVPAARREHA
jgi:integrase